MAGISNTTTSRSTVCKADLPPCPVCKGLECLCRPRFFPGQLLSDEDLNRLQNYVIGKNKLHNRYLTGWGVACGLEVVCDPCKPANVVVRAGYALSPCGDDIVLCGDQTVNVCELIERCRVARAPVCDPPYLNPPRECTGDIEQWVLAVCYDEKPSRGVTALNGAGDTNCGCGAGGGCGCGSPGGSCGCGGGSGGSGGSPVKAGCACGTRGATKTGYAKAKAKRPQCEPTQICEGFTFKAYPAPKPENRLGKYPLPYGNRSALMSWLYGNRATLGPLLDRVLCCVLAAMDLRSQVREGRSPDGRTLVAMYADYVDALRDFARDFAIHDCAALTRMNEVVADAKAFIGTLGTRAPSDAEQLAINRRLILLDTTWMNLIAECFCSALLPACPEPATDNCVPLAVVTLQKRNCRIVEICNWQERKLLITWPTITYWLSWLPWDNLKRWVARLCCGDTRSSAMLFRMLQVLLGSAAYKTRGSVDITPASAAERAAAANSGASRGTAGAEAPLPEQEFTAAMAAPNLMQYVLEGFDKMAAGTDKQAPQWAALAARLVDGRALAPLAGNAAVADVNVRDLASHLGVTRLQSQLEELARTVEAQKKVIDALQIVNTRK
jgi:hypothetical protein